MAVKTTRSTVNEQQYSAAPIPKSGFNLSYKKYSSYGIGRIHISGYQDTMPGDKISGKNDGNFTMKRIVTPMVSDLDVLQYNVFIPLRALDRTFERAFAPNKNNAMSASWTAPTVSTRYLVNQLLLAYYSPREPEEIPFGSLFFLISEYPNRTLQEWLDVNSDYHLYGIGGIVEQAVNSLRTGVLHDMAKKMYLDDALLDIADNIELKLGTSQNPYDTSNLLVDFLYLLLDCLLTPWVGRFSYYGELKYKYLRPFDFYRISRGIGVSLQTGSFSDFLQVFDDTPLNEYPLRAMYAIWYERFRNVDLEPVSNDLPYWKDFGSTSIFDMSAGGNLCYLIYRIRSWYDDEFTTAQIDDLSRHVYAPILSQSSNSTEVSFHQQSFNNLDANQDFDFDVSSLAKPTNYLLFWRDQVTGQNKSISCPVPSNIQDILSRTDQEFLQVYGLDLNTLRQSQQLERYLKRNYLFGDEYQDRMLAHYNSRVSDMRINRPEIISMSMNGANMEQEVSNVSTDETKVGDRTATGTLKSSGDQFTIFCEEFGVLLNLICFMPRASYDGIHPHLLLSKVNDYPIPEFATNNEEFGRKMEVADSGISATLVAQDGSDNRYIFGRYPAYHSWRERVDEVGGDFLDELQECTFRRFWGMFSSDTTPKLNYYFIHCRSNLGMFANTNFYDMQIYGDVVHECYVERVLPTPVEQI